MADEFKDEFKQAALDYHARPRPGKLAIKVTKPCRTQRDLALTYTPGVAEPTRAIAADPEAAYRYTNKGNLVAVVTNGSAVLGLGRIGPLAAKPVMEGKCVLFKQFAGIDVFDLEVDAPTAEAFIDTVARIAPGFGGINLEDIAAPDCFEIQAALEQRLLIPVFHDDQQGTAIIVAAGLLNALELQGKSLAHTRVVCVGAGAAGIASMRLLLALGAPRENVLMVDRKGVVHAGRDDLNRYKQEFAVETPHRTLADAVRDADVFVGVSGPGVLDPEMLRAMAPRPVVFALSNPDPEIDPAVAHATRDDLVMATGRSDYPNQVNNVLGFPFIFRGALDVRARYINEPMQLAAVHALRDLAREPVPPEVLAAYGIDRMCFNAEYIIPSPLDPRLIERIPQAVARAARDSGAAGAPRLPGE
ncbi:MAG: malate dehydrogenase [Gammaproteobacteria bacterium]|nr:malate dehydrogenase [Gammaproteobacteria bacterium]NIR59132.1 malate dehydrogenase [Gammaproteobacteria bacterium]